MTFKSRRKRPITVLLALTTIAAASVATAQVDDERAARIQRRQSRSEISLPSTLINASTESGHQTSTRSVSRRQERASDSLVPEPALYERPTRDQMFQLQTLSDAIRMREKEAREKEEPFIFPGSFDDFSTDDPDRLGPLWAERGIVANGTVDRQRTKDAMFAQGGTGVFPRAGNSGAIAAVLNEYVPSTDMMVSVDINLGQSNSEFGVILRAKSATVETPKNPSEGATLTYFQTGEFYSVTISATQVTLSLNQKGQTKVINSASISPKNIFRLSVFVVGPQFRVVRDGETILTAEDRTLEGHYSGLMGIAKSDQPVFFDRFEAKSYAGEFQPRSFLGSVKYFHGPNVHHFPLYFEQRALERYGHHFGNLTQPFIAHGLFFADFAFWPISLGRTHPWDCVCSDLWARPGDLVPFHLTKPVVEKKGAFLELGLIASILLVAP